MENSKKVGSLTLVLVLFAGIFFSVPTFAGGPNKDQQIQQLAIQLKNSARSNYALQAKLNERALACTAERNQAQQRWNSLFNRFINDGKNATIKNERQRFRIEGLLVDQRKVNGELRLCQNGTKAQLAVVERLKKDHANALAAVNKNLAYKQADIQRMQKTAKSVAAQAQEAWNKREDAHKAELEKAAALLRENGDTHIGIHRGMGTDFNKSLAAIDKMVDDIRANLSSLNNPDNFPGKDGAIAIATKAINNLSDVLAAIDSAKSPVK